MSSYYEKFLATGEVKCIDEEIPFEIPKGWEWCRMGNIGEWGAGATPAKGNPDYYNGNILWLRTGELNNDIVYDTEIKITKKALKECSLRLNKVGDVMIAMYGATIGKVAIVGKEMTTNQACCACTPIGIFNWFLFYFLMGSQLDFIKKGEGGAQPNISRQKLIAHLMPVPPIEEQHRIVSRIREVLPYVERYTHSQVAQNILNESIKPMLRKSILQEAIQGRLVSQNSSDESANDLLLRIKEEKQRLVKEGMLKKSALEDSVIYKGDDNKYYEQIGSDVYDISDSIPFDIPANWNWCRLKDVCSIFTGATFKKEDASTEKKGVRVLRGGNILPFELVMKPDDLFLPCSKIKKSILLRKNDIVTPAVTSLENIGKAARVQKDMNDVTVGGFVFILRSFLCNDYLSQYLLALLGSPSMGEYMKSVTNKSGQAFYNIGKERLAMAMIPLPPIKEQQRIVAQIEKLFEQLK
ncbi:restriction endonuclease subunit S [Bacteroides xylanisolvens]|nr:restriction endonuclease subunit S [Bacteroides xylanisolvens]QUR44225.1 restriction endonuclease subunit S [Bacteroides xylanisolvens]